MSRALRAAVPRVGVILHGKKSITLISGARLEAECEAWGWPTPTLAWRRVGEGNSSTDLSAHANVTLLGSGLCPPLLDPLTVEQHSGVPRDNELVILCLLCVIQRITRLAARPLIILRPKHIIESNLKSKIKTCLGMLPTTSFSSAKGVAFLIIMESVSWLFSHF